MPKTTEGSFDVKFNTEEKYTAFGKQYMRCYGNLASKGTFSRPSPNGDMAYEIKFSADCGCDTVLGDFKLAYEKAFGNKKLTLAAYRPMIFLDGKGNTLQSADFTATLTSCAASTKSNFRAKSPLLFPTLAAQAAPVSAVNATAIDSQMNYSATDVPSDITQAVADVTLYSQAAARAELAAAGVDITNSDYLKSKQWFDQVIAQMGDLGFIAHSASGGTVSQNTYSGQINLKDIVTELLSAYLGGAELDEFEAIANLIASDPDNTAVSGFLDFWWSAASYHTNNSSVAWGPVTVDQGSPSVTCVYLDIDVAFQDWRSLFVSFHHEAVNVTSSAITLNLDWGIYQQVKTDINSALVGQIDKHIRNQPLNFGS
jgi:hypothetical protein